MSNVEFIARAQCQNCRAPVKFKTSPETGRVDFLELINRRCDQCGENVIQITPLEVEDGNPEQQQ